MKIRMNKPTTKLFLSNEEELALCLFNQIHGNKRLQDFEQKGFLRGVKKKKTMDVSQNEIYRSLEKQWKDVIASYLCCMPKREVMRCLADLRNVAGCLFLKLEEKTETKP